MGKNIMFIGSSGAGKTTLIKALLGRGEASKTQALTFEGGFIDIPGEYMDIPRLNYAVTTTALDAAAIVVVQNSTNAKPSTPPNFCKMFNSPVYGVITKIDHPYSDIVRSKENLALCGVEGEIFPVSAVTGEGIGKLRAFIDSIRK